MRIAFVHGINNENNTAEGIANDWWAAITAGWNDLGLPEKPKPQIDVGYYGKVLAEATKDKMLNVVAQGGDAGNRAAALDFLRAYQKRKEISDAEVRDEMADMGVLSDDVVPQGWVQESLVSAGSALERVLRGRGQKIAKGVIPQATRYIEDTGLAAKIGLIVRSAIFDLHKEPTLVVAHSLGTVVAYDLLMQERQKEREIPLFMTIGSPLAIGMMARILPNRSDVPNAPIQKWVNAYRRDDPVTLGRPINKETLGVEGVENIDQGLIEDVNTHSPTAYLRSAPVCARIHSALP